MKVYAYVALAVVVIGGLKWAHSAVYNSGYNDAVVAQQALIQDAREDAVRRAREEWEATAEIAEAEIIVEERIVEVVRTVEKEIPTVVERIVEVRPDCADLGSDFVGLLNAQVNSGADRTHGGSDTAAEPD